MKKSKKVIICTKTFPGSNEPHMARHAVEVKELEMIRMYEQKKVYRDRKSFIFELLCERRSEVHLEKLRNLSKRAIDEARDCRLLAGTPVGRMHSTLLAHKLFAFNEQELDCFLRGRSYEVEVFKSVTRRCKAKGDDRYKTFEEFKMNEIRGFTHFWEEAELEPKQRRRLTDYGVYLFEFEYEGIREMASDYPKMNDKIGSTEWCDLEEEEEERDTGRRLSTTHGIYLSRKNFF
eukprot:TRINITY_DN7787_c0_g2_i1.p1 TRINITY_DN7787_c0_g2~~TRINITY_DN7787_c0_g2_i1.p1  ORF type:complete len:234 (+),score=28.36 TRINITY_DN7787_c0_g2_i1:740-1441(+)